MDARPYRRRATGELAIDPALHELVMNSGSLLDRLICGRPSPIPGEQPVLPRRQAAPDAAGGTGGSGKGGTGGPGPGNTGCQGS